MVDHESCGPLSGTSSAQLAVCGLEVDPLDFCELGN